MGDEVPEMDSLRSYGAVPYLRKARLFRRCCCCCLVSAAEDVLWLAEECLSEGGEETRARSERHDDCFSSSISLASGGRRAIEVSGDC
jgi:hypothetical protein